MTILHRQNALKDKLVAFSTKIGQLAATLKYFNIIINDKEIVPAFLNGLPNRIDSLISATDFLGDDEDIFTFSLSSVHVKRGKMTFSAQ